MTKTKCCPSLPPEMRATSARPFLAFTVSPQNGPVLRSYRSLSISKSVSFQSLPLKKGKVGAGQVAEGVKELAAQSDDLSSIPGTRMVGRNWLPQVNSDLHTMYIFKKRKSKVLYKKHFKEHLLLGMKARPALAGLLQQCTKFVNWSLKAGWKPSLSLYISTFEYVHKYLKQVSICNCGTVCNSTMDLI